MIGKLQILTNVLLSNGGDCSGSGSGPSFSHLPCTEVLVSPHATAVVVVNY